MNNTTEKQPSSQLQELVNKVEKALVQAGKDARLLAEQTGTPLVIRQAGKVTQPTK